MAIEKIEIATGEKQDQILQVINSIMNEKATKAQISDIIPRLGTISAMVESFVFSNNIFQVKTGNETLEKSCNYLLLAVTTSDGSKIFDSLTAETFDGEKLTKDTYSKYISNIKINFNNKGFYFLKNILKVSQYDMYNTESALMIKVV